MDYICVVPNQVVYNPKLLGMLQPRLLQPLVRALRDPSLPSNKFLALVRDLCNKFLANCNYLHYRPLPYLSLSNVDKFHRSFREAFLLPLPFLLGEG